jgi:Arc/MetJ family transcription regulator
MAKVNISLDANLVIEVMVLSNVRNAQDAIEALVLDYIERGHRTEAITGNAADERRTAESRAKRDPAAE